MCATDTPLGIALRNIRIHSASFECIKWFSILQRHGNKLFEIRQSTAQFELGRGPPYVSYHARITEKNVGGGGADPMARKQSGQRF